MPLLARPEQHASRMPSPARGLPGRGTSPRWTKDPACPAVALVTESGLPCRWWNGRLDPVCEGALRLVFLMDSLLVWQTRA